MPAGAASLFVLVLVVPALGAERQSEAQPDGDFMSMSLDQLTAIKVDKVYAASKHEQSLSDAPASVSIITAQDIQHYGYRTLMDVLNSVRGLYVTYDRNYEFLGGRGVNRAGDYGGRNLLLVDGHRLNEPIFDSTLLANDFILDADLIDSVEIVRGPGSALYGNNAFLNVINVVTKRGRDYHWAEGSVEAGGYDTYKGRFTLGHQFTNGLEMMFSGSLLESGGIRHYYHAPYDDGDPAHDGGVAHNLDYERAHSFFAKFSYGDFTLEGAYNSREKAAPLAAYDTIFNDPRFQTIDDQAFVDLKFAREFGHDWSLLARVSYHQYHYDAVQPYDYVGADDPADFVENIDLARSRVLAAEVQLSKTLSDRHVLTTGAEVRDMFQETYENYDRSPFTSYSDIQRSDYTWGAFVNTEWQLYRTNLTLHAGVRYDAFSTYDPAVNPRGALIAHPWSGGTFKLIYGQAYRTPNIFERFYSGFGYKANPDLQPETIRTYEAVYEHRFNRHFQASVSGFYNKIERLVSLQHDPSDDLFFYANRDAATAQGVEFEVEGRHESGLRGRLSYAFTQTRDTLTDQVLSNSPRHLLKLNLAVPLYRDRVFAGLEARYTSAVTTPSGGPVNGYWLVNATLFSRELAKGLEVSASIYNLLGTRYYHATGDDIAGEVARQDGRSFRVKLAYRL